MAVQLCMCVYSHDCEVFLTSILAQNDRLSPKNYVRLSKTFKELKDPICILMSWIIGILGKFTKITLNFFNFNPSKLFLSPLAKTKVSDQSDPLTFLPQFNLSHANLSNNQKHPLLAVAPPIVGV